MSGDFDSVSMGGLYGGCQFVRGDVHIGFEGGNAFGDPEFHGAARVFGVFQLMHLKSECAMALEIRSRDVNFGSCHFTFVDRAFQFEVGVRLKAAGGAQGSDASRQIEARKTCSVLVIQRYRTTRSRIKHVIVHADDSRKKGVPGEIENFGAVRHLCGSGISERAYFSIANDERLIRADRRARAIDQAHVSEGEYRGVFFYKDAYVRR